MSPPTVLALAELRDGELTPASAEAVAVARRLGGDAAPAVAIVVGEPPAGAGERLGRAGASRVVALVGPSLTGGHLGPVAAAVAERAAALDGAAIVVPSSTWGRDLAGRLAARWDAPAATNVVDLRGTAGGSVTAIRPVFGGRATEEVELVGPRAVLAIRPHAFGPIPTGGAPATVETVAVAGTAPPGGSRTGTDAVASASGPELTEASIVVSGGRGVGAADRFVLVEQLADALGAAVGASRAVTDAGWRPVSFQVGQTGRSVSPQLYVAVGISGAIQHVVGMVGSRVIVAINSDAQAPIFKVADYGIVGDLFQLLPPLTDEVRRARSQG